MRAVYIDDDGAVQVWAPDATRIPVHYQQQRVLRMTSAELRALPEYSMSLPTGTTIGKRWRRNMLVHRFPLERWVVGEYYELPGEQREDRAGNQFVGVRWYQVEIVL